MLTAQVCKVCREAYEKKIVYYSHTQKCQNLSVEQWRLHTLNKHHICVVEEVMQWH